MGEEEGEVGGVVRAFGYVGEGAGERCRGVGRFAGEGRKCLQDGARGGLDTRDVQIECSDLYRLKNDKRLRE